jgi:hypothetical protein
MWEVFKPGILCTDVQHIDGETHWAMSASSSSASSLCTEFAPMSTKPLWVEMSFHPIKTNAMHCTTICILFTHTNNKSIISCGQRIALVDERVKVKMLKLLKAANCMSSLCKSAAQDSCDHLYFSTFYNKHLILSIIPKTTLFLSTIYSYNRIHGIFCLLLYELMNHDYKSGIPQIAFFSI